MKFTFVLCLSLSGFITHGQDVDCSISSNCSDPACQFEPSIEKGCNCFDGLDNDGDGMIDKADANCAAYYGLQFVGDGSDCSIVPPGANTPFDLVNAPITSDQNTADTQSKISVGDVDGDGIPDAVITSKWNSEIRVVATASGQADGTQPGDVKSDFKTTGQGAKIFSGTGDCKPQNLLFEHENLIADIDGDGKAELFGVVSNRGGNPSTPPTCFFLVGFTYAEDNLVPMYNAIQIGTDRPGTFGIADMDGDGKAEIYMRDRIYAAETGALLATGNGNWDLDITAGPVAVNVVGDDKMELVCGTKIYSIPDLSDRNPTTPATMGVVADMNTIDPAVQAFVKLAIDPVEYGTDTHSMTSVADIDRDGNMDVVISGALNAVNGPTAVFYWNVAKGTVSHYIPTDPLYTNGWPWGTGRVNLGDANGDGKTDLTFMAGSYLHCLTTDASGNLVPLWPAPRQVNDSRSGVLTVSIYDFDNDGNPEVVYRDSQELAVIDGATGTQKLWSAVCQSHTYTEGVVIADVNGDGATDICVPCNTNTSFDINDPIQQQALGQFRLYYSSGNEWLPTRKVWNQPGYFVVNVNDDLTLPFPQLDQNMIFGEGDCANGLPGPQMPMNVFLNQVPFLSANGCPVYPAPDLSFAGDNPDNPGVDENGDGVYTPAVEVIPPICGDLGIRVRFNIVNSGDLPITDNVPVSFFIGDPTDPSITADSLLYSTTLPISNLAIDSVFTSEFLTFNSTGKAFRLYIVLNNDGSVLPIDPAGSVSNECRIDNNIYSVFIQPDPFITRIEKIKDNFKCEESAPDNGEMRVRIFKGATEVMDYSQYAFQWYTGTADNYTPISGATNYNLLGAAEGDYTAIVTNTEKGCVGIPVDTTIYRTGVDPEVIINVVSHQTVCNPPNGALEAQITGGNLGYTFEWFDIALNPLGITGPSATSLVAGNYIVRVSKDGCSKNSLPQTVDGPVVPDAQASTLSDVVDCLNPSSGSVTATALFNGVPQDPSAYRFEWYYYDEATSTRGSILPAANGTGETRTGLAAGHYQVLITNIATQCQAIQSPVTAVTDARIVPTALITELAPQTSCDPANPNGRLAAEIQVNGVPQDPATYVVEWFKGDNTLAQNLHTTVSGTSGIIAEKVSGGGVFYTVKVTTPNNCSDTEKIIITETLNVPIVTLTPTNNTICDPSVAGLPYNGSVSAAVTFDGTAVTDFTNYAITWHEGQLNSDPVIAGETSPLLAGRDAGSYTIVVERTNLYCVSDPVTAEVQNILAMPVIATDSVPSTNCVVNYNGAVISNGKASVTTVDGSAPTANYSFLWTDNSSPTDVDGQTTSAIESIQGGYTYTVIVTNLSTGCQNSDNVQLPDASILPVVSLAVDQPNSICDPTLTDPAVEFNGRIETSFLTSSGDPSHYVYTWRNVSEDIPLGTTPPLNDGPGVTLAVEYGGLEGDKNYSVIAENTVLGCTSGPAQVYLPNDLQLPAIATDSIPATNCVLTYNSTSVSNGQVSVTAIDRGGDFSNYMLLWSDDGVSPTPTNASSAIVTALEGGYQYTVLVTSKLTGCANTHTINLPNQAVVPTIDVTKTLDNVNCDAAALGSTGALEAVVTYNGTVLNAPGVTPLPSGYVITWSTSANGDVLAGQPAGTYSAYVVNEQLGCTSDPDADVVLDAFVFPTIDIPVPTDQTSCDPNAPNGAAQATVTDGLGSSFTHRWYIGMGTGGTAVFTASAQPDGTTTPLINVASEHYTFTARNEGTGCEALQSIFVPDNITYPTFTFTSTNPVTTCGTSPNGAATPFVGGVSSLPDYNFTVYYVETFTGGSYPTDPAVIKAGTAYAYNNAVFAQPPLYDNLAPGYISALVVDNNTHCESNAVTAPIINATEDYDITINTSVNAGFCGGDGGGIEVTIERTDNPGVPCSTCTFEWYKGTPVNTEPVNFFNNPPDMGGTPMETLVVGEDLGMPAAPPGVGSGTYTLIVIDTDPAHLGCGDYFVESVGFTDAPTVAVTKNDVSKCLAPFDGSLDVNVIGPSFDGYSVEIYVGNRPGGTLVTSAGLPAGQLAPVNISASMLEDGQYYVQVVDYEGNNENCPLGSIHELKPLAFDPLITWNDVVGNTSCDPLTSADGKVELTAVAHPQQVAPTDFVITSVSPTPLGLTFPRDLPDDGITSSGLMEGFAPEAYTFTVTDNNSGCFANALVNIPDQPVMPTIFEVEAFDDSYCAPASNGSIVITQVGIGAPDPVSEYEFEWYSSADASLASLVYSDVGGGSTTGELFDETKTGWTVGAIPGAGNGNRKYFVRGRRITGSGTGCYTPLVQKDVLDVHKTPNLTLTTFDNTSCVPGEGEGVIRALAEIENDPRDANVLSANYVFTWSPDPADGNTSGGAGVANGSGIPPSTAFDITALTDNTYTVNAINEVNGCAVSRTATIRTNPLPITILSYTQTDQLICNPDGSITVTQVTIDASKSANPAVYNFVTSDDPLTNLSDNFDFQWFNAADDGDLNASTFDGTTPLQNSGTEINDVILTADATLTGQPYPSMGQGTYYVVAVRRPGMTPGAGCATVPVRVEVGENINYPEITHLTPFANTSCETGTVEGRIELAVQTASSVAAESGATYSFIWLASDAVNNPGGTGSAANVDNATATNLMVLPQGYVAPPATGPALKDDTYTVTVTNDYSGCSVTGQTVVTPQRYPVTLISYSQQDQMICYPDGNITVTKITIDGTRSGIGVFDYTTLTDLRANFDFSWYNADNDGDGNTGTFDNTLSLDDGSASINDAILTEDASLTSQPYPAMSAGSYYVVAKRKAGLSPGAGCTAEPVRVNIADLHVNPTVSLTYEPNSSCDPVNPNGVVVATAAERDGSTADTYGFTWTLNGDSMLDPATTASTPANNVGRLDDAADGRYVLTATNVSNTGCQISASIDVLKNLNISTPNIIDVETIDPVDCYPTGSAAVTRISIGGVTFYNNPPDNLDNTFDYKWFKGDYVPTTEIAGEVNHDLIDILPDKYYVVVEDVRTACESSPKEVVIVPDNIVYPVLAISQTQRQISCPASLGTGVLASTADGRDSSDPNYSFTWYNNLQATGTPIGNSSTITNLIAGDYSVSVTNSVTGCSAADLYIISNESEEYYPQLALSTQPRENCLVNDGSLLAREVGWNPNSGYPFAADYTTEIYQGAAADVTQPGELIPNVPGFDRNWSTNTLDVGIYTVKIRDNNTGCIITAEAEVTDLRTPPVVTIVEDHPLVNCDPARPNGQLSATADNGLIGGYQFNWHEGTVASGPVVGVNNKLIGLPMGQFTVRVTNDVTGCFADETASITDGRLVPPSPTPVLIFDRTRCDYPDGWVAANVNGVTLNYTFDWYDGTTVKNTPDFTGVNYRDRDVGTYTVTAMDQVTGCVSLPEAVEVKDLRVIPEVVIHTQPSYCDELPDAPGGNGSAQIALNPSNIIADEIIWTEASGAQVGIGSYITGVLPGFYQASITTSQGCQATGIGEVETEVFSYNLVSSNGDRKNDNFMIDCISQFPNNNVKIFNRSGVLVYEADGYNNNDVVFKGIGEKGVYTIGNELPVGTYFYIIDKRNGSKPKTGYLELVR